MQIDRGGQVIFDLIDGREKALEGHGAIEIIEDVQFCLVLLHIGLAGDTDDKGMMISLFQPEQDTVVE